MIKAKLWIFGVILGSMLLTPALSYGNLLVNPGFESDWAGYWTRSHDLLVSRTDRTNDPASVHQGEHGASIFFFGNLEQSFSLPDAPFLYFSAYVRLYTTNFEGNTGLVLLTLELPDGSDVVVGGPVNSLGLTFEEDGAGLWLSKEWLQLEGTVDLSGFSAGSSASIDISFLPGDVSGIVTTMYVDDVMVQHTPLPWAVWLFGSGLLGLSALKKRLNFG